MLHSRSRKITFGGKHSAGMNRANDLRGTQRPNVSKYARSVSDGFSLCALDVALKTIFICSDVLGNFGRDESFRWLFRVIRKC